MGILGSCPALANNGLNLIGFGAESTLTGGADTASAHDSTSLNTNPAGLARVARYALDAHSAVAYAIDIAHADQFGNDTRVSNDIVSFGGGGYARRLADTDVVVGLGFFVQGGAGAVYKNLHTAFGSTDELSALTGIAKLTPGIAWQPTEHLSVGAAVAATLARSDQKIFPETSVAPSAATPGFFGSDLHGAEGIREGFRLGAQYSASPDLVLGGVVANRVALPLSGGHMDVNMNAVGLGSVTYRDIHLEGLALPQEVSLGAAWKVVPTTELRAKLSRLSWSRAIASLVLDARQPSNVAAPAEIRTVQALAWHDRNVVALGVRHEASERLTLLAGANYSGRPMDSSTLSPTFAPIGQKHVTLGIAYRLSDQYEFTSGLEYQLPEHVRYTNPQLPFGVDTQTRGEYVALHAALSRRW